MQVLIFPIIWLFLTGCSNMLGGYCEYKRVNGIATILGKDNNVTVTMFHTESDTEKKSFLMDGDLFYKNQRIAGHTGSRYPAIMNVRTKGACVPLQLEITGDEILGSNK